MSFNVGGPSHDPRREQYDKHPQTQQGHVSLTKTVCHEVVTPVNEVKYVVRLFGDKSETNIHRMCM